MWIALSILKILGLILLFVLALILFILAILLFTPIKYYIASDNVDKPCVFVKLSIWLNMFALTYFYKEGVEENRVILFWLKFDWDRIFNKKKKKHKIKKKKQSEKKEKISKKKQAKAYEQCKGKNESIKDKIKSIINIVKEKLTEFNSVKNKKELLAYMLELLKGLFKALKTKKFKANFKFGFDEPDKTGMLLGFGCGMNAFLPVKIGLEADFENEVFLYDAEIKGKTCIFLLLVPIIKFILKKPIWDLIFNGEEE